jgi:hypothetical protein
MQLKSLSTYSIIMHIHKNHKPDSMVREISHSFANKDSAEFSTTYNLLQIV